MYLSKMGTKPSKICACRDPLECGSHNDVQVGIKSPTNVTDTETHSECGTARSEVGIRRSKNLQRKVNAQMNMIVLCDLCGHTWGSKPWHKSSKPTRYRNACNGTIGRIHDLSEETIGKAITSCMKRTQMNNKASKASKSVRFHDDFRSKKNVQRSVARATANRAKQTDALPDPVPSTRGRGCGTTDQGSRKLRTPHDAHPNSISDTRVNHAERRVRRVLGSGRPPLRGVRASHIRRLNEIVMNMARNANKGDDSEFVLDSGASIHLIRRNKWLGKLLNRHKVMIRDAVGKQHPASDTGVLRMRVKTRDGRYHDLGDMGTGAVVQDLFHNLLSVSELCKNGFTVVFKPERCEIESPDGTVIPITARNGLYFVEGENLAATTREYHGMHAHVVACAREHDRQQELAFLSKVDGIDEAVFDFANAKTSDLDGLHGKAKEKSRRTSNFKYGVMHDGS